MASSDSASGQPSRANSFNIETTMPLRESKTSLGPFRATQIWNEMIQHLKSKVELKRRRHKMRYYDNCFTGTDAVDVILHYLLSDRETFSADLSREKAVKVCQLLMSRKAFEPVGCRQGDTTKHTFEDSGGKLYCFPVSVQDVENMPPAEDSDDDSLYEDSDNALTSDSKRFSLPLESLSETRRQRDREADTRSVTSLTSDSSSSILLPESDPPDKVPSISKDVIEETWREIALAQLTTLIDLTFLDGVLAQDKPSKRQQQHHNLIISNIVAKNWHRPLTQSLINLDQVGLHPEEESVIQRAIACIECLPKGASLLAEHSFLGNDSNTKRQAFDILRKHYSGVGETILPGRFFDLHMAVLNLILQQQQRQAVKALRLDMVLLPLPVKEELHRLLLFMAALALDTSLVLDPMDSNEVVALRAFSDAIFQHKLLAPNLGSILVQFMMQHLHKVFTVPSSLRDRVSHKLYQIKTGNQVPSLDTAFCERVSQAEYARQARDCTQEGLIAMVNGILDDTRMTLKEKKQRLKQFQKCYPTLYEEHFSGML
ncbi:DEP domain-containing protein 7-like [Babylonia areolata]|uniref:DEP domain-containing protein 7-like n=1 Tax=Babylonia areolata TaxID=304850 RepID=UPI003FD08150